MKPRGHLEEVARPGGRRRAAGAPLSPQRGNIGDATDANPGMMDVLEQAKLDTWAARKRLARVRAMADQVKLVAALEAKIA